jgi:hypothetical protein
MVAISETLQQEGKYNNCFHFFAGAIMSLPLRVVRESDCQCQSRNSPRFDPSILRFSEIMRGGR